jgi:hypothetical protein
MNPLKCGTVATHGKLSPAGTSTPGINVDPTKYEILARTSCMAQQRGSTIDSRTLRCDASLDHGHEVDQR